MDIAFESKKFKILGAAPNCTLYTMKSAGFGLYPSLFLLAAAVLMFL